MRLAFVIPWRDQGRWLFAHLPEGYEGDLLFAVPEGHQSKLPPYVRELFWLWRRGYRVADYDAIFTWELRCTLATLILRRVQRAKVRVIAVGPILKGRMRGLLPVIRPLLQQAQTIVCFSSAESEAYVDLLRIPREALVFLPTPWDAPADTPASTDGGFALALGQSNRDYATLFRAVEGLRIPVTVVAADAVPFGGVIPPSNVTIKLKTNHEETSALIASARLHVIPLHPTEFSSGQTVLLRAMAAGKACIVSDVPGIRDYIAPYETAVVVPAHDPVALRAALMELWDSAPKRERLGQAASQAAASQFSFPGFLRHLLELL